MQNISFPGRVEGLESAATSRSLGYLSLGCLRLAPRWQLTFYADSMRPTASSSTFSICAFYYSVVSATGCRQQAKHTYFVKSNVLSLSTVCNVLYSYSTSR